VLVLQRSVDGSPVHAVWGVPRGYNLVITIGLRCW
jgi:hypothetical protein